MLPRLLPVPILFLTLLLSPAAGCGSADDTPPVAEVHVTADRTRTPIGAPVRLTYRFTPRDAIQDDYVVFAHLVNPDGQALWNDDHQPPVPTSEWQPGEAVEYTREVFLPVGQLRPGDATLEVGLYRGGDRLLLDAPRAPRTPAARAYPVVDLELAPESENVFLVFQAGWHPDEFATDQSGRSWKWTQQAASVVFRNPGRDATLLLEYAGRPDAFGDTPQQLQVLAGGTPVAAFAVDSDQTVLRRIPLTSEQLGSADMVELQFEVDRTFVPAEHGIGNGDRRELGIRVFNVFVDVR